MNNPDAPPLHGKTALIHGGGGAIGGAVARAFACSTELKDRIVAKMLPPNKVSVPQ